MLIMSSVAVKTIEENNDKKKNGIITHGLKHGVDGVEEEPTSRVDG